MTDKTVDDAVGRAKEAAGALTKDRGLKQEGQEDQARASLKNGVDRLADKAKHLLDHDHKD